MSQTSSTDSTSALWLDRPARILFSLLGATVFFGSISARISQLTHISRQHYVWLSELGLSPGFFVRYVVVCDVILFGAFTVLAWLIALRRPRERAVTFIVIMLVNAATALTRDGAAVERLPAMLHVPYLLNLTLSTATIISFIHIFPDSPLTSTWIRLIAIFWSLVTVGWHFGQFLLHPSMWPQPDMPVLLMTVMVMSGVITQIYRYRRVSEPAQRQQTKWVVSGIIVAGIGFIVFQTLPMLVPAFRLPSMSRLIYIMAGLPLFYLAVIAMPVTFAFSVLRYRLWDIDGLVNRTLIYGTLSGGLGLMFVGLIVFSQLLLRVFIGNNSGLTIALSTAVIAILFNPLRLRIQTWIDSRFYRRKQNMALALARFSREMSTEVDAEPITQKVFDVVETTLHPQHIGLWIRPAQSEVES